MSQAKAKNPKKKKGKGRPKKNEAWRLKRFVEGTRKGLTRKLAAQFAGMSLSTAEDYLKRGREGQPVYSEFSEAVYEAEADGAAKIFQTIAKHSRKDWRAGAWILNNRHGDEYKAKQVIAGDPDAPLGVREVVLPAPRKDD